MVGYLGERRSLNAWPGAEVVDVREGAIAKRGVVGVDAGPEGGRHGGAAPSVDGPIEGALRSKGVPDVLGGVDGTGFDYCLWNGGCGLSCVLQ